MLLLRGHHLVCLHFFSGEGYDGVFTENLRNILARVEEGDITITSGADHVCRACLHLRGGRCEYTEEADTDIREMDQKAIDLLRLSDSVRVRWGAVRDSVRTIFPEWHSLYCTDCDWRGDCEGNRYYQELLHTIPDISQGGER